MIGVSTKEIHTCENCGYCKDKRAQQRWNVAVDPSFKAFVKSGAEGKSWEQLKKEQKECRDMESLCANAGCNLFTHTPLIRDWLMNLYPGSGLMFVPLVALNYGV